MARLAACVALVVAACSSGTPRILSTSRLGDTRDPTGPYGVEIVTAGLDSDDRVEVRWSVSGTGSFQAVRATRSAARDDVFESSLPGQPAGTALLYFSAIVRSGTTVAADPDLAPGDGHTYPFRVLARSGVCRADSDCRSGFEICNSGTCRAYQGTCLRGDAGVDCPDGYGCDTATNLCVILPRACQNDGGCPSVERCDPSRHVCVARPTCLTTGACPDGLACDARLGLCFAAP